MLALSLLLGLTVASAPNASAAYTAYGYNIGGNWWGTYIANNIRGGCIDPRKAAPAGGAYTASTVSAPASAYMLWQYSNVADNETGALVEYMTQSATDLVHSGKNGNVPEYVDQVRLHQNKFNSMSNDINANKGPYAVSINVTTQPTASSPTGTATVEVLSKAGNEQPVTGNPNITVTIGKTGSVSTTSVSSITLTPTAKKVSFTFTMGTGTTNSTALNGTVTGASTTAPPTVVTILSASDASYQRIATTSPTATSTATSDSDTATRPASANGQVRAYVKDKTNGSTPLPGTYVYFYSSSGRSIGGQYVTGSDGYTGYLSVTPGSYRVYMRYAPSSYNADGGYSAFASVTAGGQTTLQLTATEQGMVGVRKVDAQNTALGLGGAGFSVTTLAGVSLATFTTNVNGNAGTGYLPGGVKVGDQVRITETKTPGGGYVVARPSVVVTVTRANSNPPTIQNQEQSKVSVHLTDTNTGKGLAGGYFQVSIGGTKYGLAGVTNADGNWTYPGYLPVKVGSGVTIKQVRTTAGYVVSTGSVVVTSTRTGTGSGVWNVGNYEQSRVSVHKTDTSTAKPLSGAQFRVLSGSTVLASGTTDANGNWLSPLLTTTRVGAPGITIKETVAPSGFNVTAAAQAVTPTRNGYTSATGTTALWNLADTRVYAQVSVAKNDSVTNKVIPGVTFTATVRKIGTNGVLGAAQQVTGGVYLGTETPAGSGNYVTSASGIVSLQGLNTSPKLVFGDQVTFTESVAAPGYVQPIVAVTITGTVGPNALLLLSAFNSPQRSVQITDTDQISKQQITTATGAGYTICYTPAVGRVQSAAEKAAASPCPVPTGTGLNDPVTKSNVDPSKMILVDTVSSNGGKSPVSQAAKYAQSGDKVTIFETSAPAGYVASTSIASTTITDTGWGTSCINTGAGGTGGSGSLISCTFADQPIPTATMTKRIVDWGTTTTAAGYVPSGAHYIVKDVTTGQLITSDAGPTDSTGKLTVLLPGIAIGDQISFVEITAPTGTTLDATPVVGTVAITGSGVGVSVTQSDMTNDPCGSTAWNYKALDQPVVSGTVTPLTPVGGAVAPGVNAYALRSQGATTQAAPTFILTWPAVGQALTYTVTRKAGDGSTGGVQTYLVSGSAATPDANGNITFSWSGDATNADAWQSDYLWSVTAQNPSVASPSSTPVHLSSQAQAPQNAAATATTRAFGPSGTQPPLDNVITWNAPASATGSAAGGFHQGKIVGYTIWLAAADGSWSAIGTAPPVSGTTQQYKDLAVPASSTRTYAVTARTALGDGEAQATQALLSPFSNSVTVTQVASPIQITGVTGSGTTTISWPALAAGQTLKIIKNGLTTVKAGLTTSPYTVTGEPVGSDSYYSAVVTDAAGDSIPGNSVHVAQAPPAPAVQVCASAANLGGQACTGGAPGTNVITWNFPYDSGYNANNQLDQRAEFQIYRSLASDTALASPSVDMSAPILQSLDPTAANFFNPSVFTAATSTTTNTLAAIDPNREPGSNYTYAVVACNQNVQSLAWQCSSPTTSNVQLQYPDVPTGIVGDVQTANTSDQVSWTAVAGATGYNLYESGNLDSCIASNLTSVEENSLTTQIDSTGAVTTNPAPITGTSVTNISAPAASCYAFSVQAVNATGAGVRSNLDAGSTPASYVVQYPPVNCYNPAGATAGATNTSITSYLAGAPGTCSVDYPNSRAHMVQLYRRTVDISGNLGPWILLAPWYNTTGVEDQTSISVQDSTGVVGQQYQYSTHTCSLSLATGNPQCTINPVQTTDQTVITQP